MPGATKILLYLTLNIGITVNLDLPVRFTTRGVLSSKSQLLKTRTSCLSQQLLKGSYAFESSRSDLASIQLNDGTSKLIQI